MRRSIGRVALGVAVMAPLVLAGAAQPALAAKAHVVHITMTRSWSVPAADPRGLTYNQGSHRLLISDSEIDETNRWKGRNFFVASPRGHLRRVGTLAEATMEPEDLAWNNRRQQLFAVDDDRDRVFRFRSGPDHVIGTKDDRVKTVLRTRRFGATDPEGLGIAVRYKMLILTDSTRDRVYKVRPGKDRRFGTSDDAVASFSTRRLGFQFPTDVTWDKKSGHLFIVGPVENWILETTIKGRLVRKIDLAGSTIRSADGIAFGRGSDGQPHHLYVVDAGIDDSVNPNQNDGRLFEFKLRSR